MRDVLFQRVDIRCWVREKESGGGGGDCPLGLCKGKASLASKKGLHKMNAFIFTLKRKTTAAAITKQNIRVFAP